MSWLTNRRNGNKFFRQSSDPYWVMEDGKRVTDVLTREHAIRVAKNLHLADQNHYHEVYGQRGGVFQLKPKDLVLPDGTVKQWLYHEGRYDE